VDGKSRWCGQGGEGEYTEDYVSKTAIEDLARKENREIEIMR